VLRLDSALPPFETGEHWKIAGCPVQAPALATAEDGLVLAWFTAAAGSGRVRAVRLDAAGKALGGVLELDTKDPVGRVGWPWAPGRGCGRVG
jgi:hypothetical protein